MRLPGDVDGRMAWAVWMRNLTVYRHTWVKNILPNFFEPLLYLLGMGLGLGFYLQDGFAGDSYLVFIAPGLMAAAAMNGASFESTYNVFIKMNFARLYDAFLATPAAPQDIAFGELLWAATRAFLYGIGFLVVLIGLTVTGTPVLTSWWAVLIPPALVLAGLLFGLIGLTYTAHIKTIDLYGYYFTLWITPLFLFSGIFYPVERFPYGDQIAWFTPLYHAVRLMRGLAWGANSAQVVVSVLWIVAVIVALSTVMLRAMRRRMIK